MAELYLFKHTDEEIIKRVREIDWNHYYLDVNELKKFAKIAKFTKFLNIKEGYANIEKNYGAIALLIYDSSYNAMINNGDSKNFISNCIQMENMIKDVFFIHETLCNINNWFEYIDNDITKKIKNDDDNEVDLTIMNSKGLRAFKYKMIKCFYNDLIKFFLNLVMVYYYNVEDFKFSGLQLDECGERAARIILSAKHIYEKQLMKEWGGDAIIDKLNKELNTKPKQKKSKKNSEKKSEKTTELEITDVKQ